MEATSRQLRWVFGYRVATLGAVAFLLPPLVPLAWAQMPWLLGVAAALLIFWSAPVWREPRYGKVFVALALALEGVLVSALAFGFGGVASPIMLLLLPAIAQAAISLPTPTYVLTACTILSAYGILAARTTAGAGTPYWLPLWVAALVLTTVWLGVAGAILRRNRFLALHEARHAQQYRALVDKLPAIATAAAPADRGFWHAFLAQVCQTGGFASAALVRWDGPRPDVTATDRESAWQGLVSRHAAVFRQAAGAKSPLVFVEGQATTGQGLRAIACWALSPRAERVSGLLCVMAPAPLDVAQAGKRLGRFLPLAAIALALGSPRLALHRQPVDWQVIVNATLQRLHGRLSRYLVLVHVDDGSIDADALLLSDAVAHVIEEVLDRTPPMTPVRLTVRHGREGWRFQVETEHPPAATANGPRPGLLLARQVVSAHGGAWEQVEATATAYRLGFVLPEAVSASARNRDLG